MAEKANGFAQNHLMIYFAAKRAKMPVLAQHSLKLWATKMGESVAAKMPHQQGIPDFLSIPIKIDVAAIITKKVAKMRMPVAEKSLQAVEKEMIGSLKGCVAKEIVFQVFHPTVDATMTIPPHVNDIIGSTSPGHVESYLINRYAPLQELISFASGYASTITNDDVRTYLRRFPNATTIDLTNCVKLTHHCLQTGHDKVETIILKGTCIQESEINRKLFPALKKVVQEKPVKIYKLPLPSYACSAYGMKKEAGEWIEIRKAIEDADIVMCVGDTWGRLLTSFKNYPSMEGYETLRAIGEHASKFQGGLTLDYKAKDADSALMSVVKYADPKDLMDPNSLARKFYDYAVKESNGESKRFKGELDVWYQDTVTLPLKDVPGQALSARILSSEEIKRAEFVIKVMRGLKFNNYYPFTSELEKHLRVLESHLFFQRAKMPISSRGDTRDRTVATIEHFLSLYVELSYQAAVGLGPFAAMQDPATAKKRVGGLHGNDSMVFIGAILNIGLEKAVTPSDEKLYKSPTDQMLACAFALKVSKELREKLLRNILKDFTAYRSDNKECWPLAKVALGAIEHADIPDYARNSPLAERLLKYKGIMAEDIDAGLKEELWTALSSGKLGGSSKTFVDATVVLYNRNVDMRERILDFLKDKGGVIDGPLSGNQYHVPLTGDSYAREKYYALTGR